VFEDTSELLSPLKKPHSALDNIAQTRDPEKPKRTMQPALASKPKSIMGFRPSLSEAMPHNVAVSI